MVTDKWMFIAMELENRDETKDKADYLKSLFGRVNEEKLINALYGEFVNMIGHHSPSLKIKIRDIVSRCAK